MILRPIQAFQLDGAPFSSRSPALCYNAARNTVGPASTFNRNGDRFMSRVATLLLLTAGLLAGAGCAVDQLPGPGIGGDSRPTEFIGEVVYVRVEGGFHGIVTHDGRKLDPINLAESLKRAGMIIEGAYRVRDDVIGIRQWGTIVELVHQQRAYQSGEAW
jgi:hypothetical protein